MNAIEFLFNDNGAPTNYLIKTETQEQEQRLLPIAKAMLRVMAEGIQPCARGQCRCREQVTA